MSFNEELLITNMDELEDGENYLLLSHKQELFDGIYTYYKPQEAFMHRFINSLYEIRAVHGIQINSHHTNNIACYSIRDLVTNEMNFGLYFDIFKLTNEYILK